MIRTSLVSLFVTGAAAAGCVAAVDAPSAPNQLRGDDKADGGPPLWAGLASQTIERYTPDPCDNGAHALGDAPIAYDDWVRQRAGIRNVCFEVWQPGVTDTDNPDYWRLLDVQVHYRFGDSGPFQWAYVPSIDRRGNNRRYAWAIDYALDPFANAQSLATIPVPIHIESESPGSALVSADLEVYFTVNGEILNAPSNRPFTVHYVGQVREPTLPAQAGGYVLGDLVTCQGLRLGYGAGYFAADVTDPAAIAALGHGLDGSLIYGTGVALGGTGAAQILSTTFGSEMTVSGQVLPSFVNSGGARTLPAGSSIALELATYDRAAGQPRTLSATFTGCTATAQ